MDPAGAARAEPGDPSFSQLLADPIGLVTEVAVTGYYPVLVYSAYICVGIAVGRMRLASVSVVVRLLVVGVAAAAASWVASWWLLLGPLGGLDRIAATVPPEALAEVPTVADYVTLLPEGITPTTTWWWLAVVAPHSGAPLDLLHTIGVGVGLLGALLLLGHVTPPRRPA